MPLDFRRIKAICFDVDGTLSDTDDQLVHKLESILTPFQFAFQDQDVHVPARRLVMLAEGPGNWIYGLADWARVDAKIVAVMDRLYQVGLGASAEPFLMIRGVREMLIHFHTLLPISIVSARGEKSTLRFLFQFQLESYFSAVATGQTCEYTKPYPDQIFWVAEKMGVEPSSCLMVGDTVVDILSGRRAGAQTVGVLCGFGEEIELRRAGADLILETTTDLVELFTAVG